jgi:hypothetical protein
VPRPTHARLSNFKPMTTIQNTSKASRLDKIIIVNPNIGVQIKHSYNAILVLQNIQRNIGAICSRVFASLL